MTIALVPLIGVLLLLWLPAFLPPDLRRRLTDPTRLSFPTFLGMTRVWSNWLDLLRGAAGAFLLAHAVFYASSVVTGRAGNSSTAIDMGKTNTPSARAATNDVPSTDEGGDGSKTNTSLPAGERGEAVVTSKAGDVSKTNAPYWKKPVWLPRDAGDMDKAKPLPLKIVVIQFAILGLGLLIQTIRFGRGVTFFAPTFYVCGITLAQSDLLIGAAAVAVGWLIALAAKSPIYQLPVMVTALGVAGFLLSSLPLLMYCGVLLLPIMLGLLWQKRLVYVSRSHSAAHKG